MPTKMALQGLIEFRQALRSLPADLVQEANAIVMAHAADAERRITSAYPEGPTGNLRRGVVVERNSSKFTSSAIVRSRAKHAWLYDNGSGQRRTDAGVNRGRMPKAPSGRAMIPIVIRVRAQMVRSLIALVERAGFKVQA